jgi:5-methylcytosine-specific restriction endonuclease McrA
LLADQPAQAILRNADQTVLFGTLHLPHLPARESARACSAAACGAAAAMTACASGASSLLNRPVVVLNNAWTPVNLISVRNAFRLIFTTRASSAAGPPPPLATWLDPADMSLHDTSSPWAVQPLRHHPSSLPPTSSDSGAAYVATPTLRIRVPQAIVLSAASLSACPQTKQLWFTRKAVLERERFACAYCGGAADTVDHVRPRTDGGISCYTNCVACCRRCNSRKGRLSLKEAGMRLRKGVNLMPPPPDFYRRKLLVRYNDSWLELLQTAGAARDAAAAVGSEGEVAPSASQSSSF